MVTRGQNQFLKWIETVILSEASEAEAILIKIAVPQHSSCLSRCVSPLRGHLAFAVYAIRLAQGFSLYMMSDLLIYIFWRGVLDQNRRQV